MAAPPPYIAVRRARRRAQLRRRRLAAGGVAVVLALVISLVVALGSGSGAAGKRSSLHVSEGLRRDHHAPPGRSRGGPSAVMAAGNARIRRLLQIGLPIYCGGPHGNAVAFTFDDGPGPYTYLALRKLQQAGERATFFVVGRSMNNYRGYLPRELKIGAIGDHTYTHPELTALAPTMVSWQLAHTAEQIEAESGQRVDLWRPPYEAHNATVDAIARRLGLLEIFWSADSQDSLGGDWAQIVKNVEAGLRPGAIILMHENHGQTIRALTTLLPELRRRHLRSVSLPELLASDPPSAAQLRQGWSGCGAAGRTPAGAGG